MNNIQVPFLRWSFLRMIFGRRTLQKEWQVGDGREEKAAEHVIKHAKPGDIDDALRAIDEFAYKKSHLINVGDKKGLILDNVIKKTRPKLVLELGAYVGYSALRIARQLPPDGRLYSVEFSAANAAIARKIIKHAGADDRITVVTGYLGDGGTTIAHLKQNCSFEAGALDVVFVDHAKEAYLPDLMTMMNEGWLHSGSVVVADNMRIPGAPEYKSYMEKEEGKVWRTVQHDTVLEYQNLLADVVLESTLI